MINKYIEVRKSSIPSAGMGVFAKESLSEGQRIGEYKGQLISREEFKGKKDTYYVFEVSRKVGKSYKTFYIDARYKKYSNILRYVNGARTTTQKRFINVRAYQYGGKIYYKTLKPLRKGEELLLDYGDSYWH